MNLILLFPDDFTSPTRVRLADRRRTEHVTSILRSEPGDRLCVGLCDGNMGWGTVVSMGDDVLLDVVLDTPPPDPLRLTLIMALPRPNVLKRTLICAASLGIKNIIVLNFNRVEKSLWQSSALRPEVIRECLILGLEQAKDTRLPQVLLKDRFKPFVEDELPELMKGTLPLMAHPSGEGQLTPGIKTGQPVTLIIGPEGGIIDYEIQHLTTAGFHPITLGPRILKIESALPYLAGILSVG